MAIRQTLVASSVAAMFVLGALGVAPVAHANYAPQLPSSGQVEANQRVPLVVRGVQPNCRVTFSTRQIGGPDNIDRGLERRKRVRTDQEGVARTQFRMPTQPGRYQFITRVDNFPGQTGCTPTKTVQRIIVR
jgi:hypothetical protein